MYDGKPMVQISHLFSPCERPRGAEADTICSSVIPIWVKLGRSISPRAPVCMRPPSGSGATADGGSAGLHEPGMTNDSKNKTLQTEGTEAPRRGRGEHTVAPRLHSWTSEQIGVM
uniref:Uncharacterized protein n=1 Tax=Knipowitschia caucasica TaxID=637954 RepID=A0AAV2M184_KNICA